MLAEDLRVKAESIYKAKMDTRFTNLLSELDKAAEEGLMEIYWEGDLRDEDIQHLINNKFIIDRLWLGQSKYLICWGGFRYNLATHLNDC